MPAVLKLPLNNASSSTSSTDRHKLRRGPLANCRQEQETISAPQTPQTTKRIVFDQLYLYIAEHQNKIDACRDEAEGENWVFISRDNQENHDMNQNHGTWLKRLWVF